MRRRIRLYRNIVLAVLLLLAYGRSVAQGEVSHFQPVANTGIHRAVVVNTVTIDDFILTEGDEIAVFDGELCVGAAKITANNELELTPVAISSILKVSLPNGTQLPGATIGHSIMYRLWDMETNSEFTVYSSGYSSGDGTFGQSYTVAYSLTASIAYVTIETDPAELPFTLNGEEFTTNSFGEKDHICNQGATYTISVDTVLSKGEDGIRYYFNNWSDGQAISHTFAGPTGNWRITANFFTQYELDVVSDYNNANGSGWFNSGTDVEISVDTSYVPVGVDNQYMFTGWAGTGGAEAYTGSDSSHTVTMLHPITETALWQLQYYLHTSVSDVQTGDIYPEPPGRWYDSGATAEVFAVGGDGFQLANFSGITETPVGNTVMVLMDAPKNVIASFKKEITIVIKTTPLNLEYVVDGEMYNLSRSFTWFENELHTLSVADTSLIQNEGNEERNEFNAWSDGEARTHNYRVTDTEETITAVFDTVYQLILDTGPGSGQGSDWYKKGSTANFSIDSEYSPEVDGQRFRFTGWQGIEANAYNGPDQSQSIIMSNPITQTALWQKQFEIDLVEDPDEGGNITLDPTGGWYDEDTRVGVKAESLTGYSWSGWGGDLSGTADSLDVFMGEPKTAVAYFAKVVQVVVQSDPEGMEFYVDGIQYNSAQTFTWFKDSTHVVLIADSLQAEENGSRYRYANWSDGGGINHEYATPNVNSTVTVNFQPQHYLTVNGTNGTATGTGWFDEGQAVTFNIDAMNIEKGDCTRYHFTGWSGTGVDAYTGPDSVHAIPISGPITQTALWETEFLLTVVSEYGTPSGESWYAKGATAEISVTPDTVETDVDERYYFSGWTGEGDGSYTGPTRTVSLSIDTCVIETVVWQKQYSLTSRIWPAGTGSISLYPAGQWYGSGVTWYNSGEAVEVTAVPGAADPFREFTGDLAGSTNPQFLYMTEPKEVTANFDDFTHLGIDADHPGVEFKYLLDGDTITVATPHSFSTSEGEEFILIVDTEQTIGDSIQYTFNGWADGETSNERTYTVSNTDATLTITVDAEYKLTVASPYDTPLGSGWYNEGNIAEYSITSPVSAGDHMRRMFTTWIGDVVSTEPAGSITMDGPKFLAAVWKMQYELTLDTEYGSPYGHGWYFEADTALFGVSDPFYQSDSVRYKLIEWGGTGTGSYTETDTTIIESNGSVVMNNPIYQLAKWERQNRLALEISPANGGTVTLDPPGGWYRSGISVLLTPDESAGYLWGGWEGAITGMDRPKAVVMNFPKSVKANFGTYVSVEVGTNPPGLNYYIDGQEFTSDSTFNLVIGDTYWFSTDSPQSKVGEDYIRYLFTDWSTRDDNDQGFKYVPSASEVVTVNFKKQYQLLVRSAHGEPFPDSTKPSSWYDDVLPPKSGEFGIATRTVYKNNDEKYTFNGWSSSSSGGYTGQDSVHSVNMVVPVIETADWDTLYKLTWDLIPSGKGAIQVDPVKDWYTRGETVTLITTLIDSSYQFSGWSGTTSSINDTMLLVMDQPHNLLAEYELVTHEVITEVKFVNPDGVVIADSGGTIVALPGPTNGKYNLRTNVRFGAVPKSGYRFIGWTGALSGTSNPQNLYILSDVTLTATFVLDDNVPPYIDDSYPVSGSANLPINTGVEFKVIDDVYGVDRFSLHVNINGVSLVSSGVASSGAMVTAVDKGFKVAYTPTTDFGEDATVTITVSCDDKANPRNTISNRTIAFNTGSSRIVDSNVQDVPVQLAPITITDPETGVKLTFPGNTLSDQLKVVIGRVDEAPLLQDSTKKNIIGNVYYFSPDGIEFNNQIQVVIPFPVSALSALGVKTKDAIKVYSFITADNEWVEVPNVVVDDVNGTVTFSISQFSYFRISAATPGISPGQVINYPNPFNPDGAIDGERTTAIKYKLPNKTSVTMKIFDVSGTMVREFTSDDGLVADAEAEVDYIVTWDGKNGAGTIVANNVYFCVITTGSSKVYVRKIVVLR